ncbi:Addiction module protein [Methylorubrum populi]
MKDLPGTGDLVHSQAMTELLDKAITAVRNLPPEAQDAIARMVLSYAGKEQPIYRFPPEEEAELDESEAAAARGDFATDEEVRAIWAKHGL